MKRFLSLLMVFCIFFCSLQVYAARYEIEYGAVVSSPALAEMIKESARANSDLMYPPSEHPYIFVNDDYIKFLKEHKDDEVYKQAYSYQLSLAKKELPPQPEGGILSSSISNQLNARAFMYMMGEVNKAHAKETVDYAIEYVKNAKTKETYSINIYKDYGNQGIQCGALVYDWCFSAMNAAQKAELAEAVRNLMISKDQPCRHDNIASAWSDINGKSVGQPLIYMSIASSALYDVYPDIYENIMRKVQGTMAEISKIYGEAAALTDGSTAYTREYYTYYVEILFQRMGHDISKKYGVQLPLGYKLLYGRLPYGTHLKTGDSWTQVNYKYGSYSNSSDITSDMGMLQVMFEDPYLKHYYQRDNSSSSAILDLLLKKSYHEAKTPDDLPLAFEAYTPRSEILAKTSWQEGLDSPQVMAYLNMNNRRSGDHDHAEHGTFQLHYKGPLTVAQGNYHGEAWGGNHWKNYLTRTIATNGMLLYQEGEVYSYGPGIAQSNDGGQKMAGSKDGKQYVIADLEEHMSEWNNVTKTESTYMGPNAKTPAFSYIKGNLTGAYNSSKMGEYKRGMVFMDTFNETYPGVLVVFDRMVSKNAASPKTWLLQAVDEPKIEGNKITIDNSKLEETANGKLVNTVLLPEQIEIGVEGGLGKYVVNGVEYPVDGEVTGSPLYKSGWRAEVKPKKAAEEDIFLNAMFVADADTTAPDLEMKKVENDIQVGVVTLDRQVMFSKNAKFLEEEFSVKVEDNNGGKEMLTLITDVTPGKWSVTGEGLAQVVEVKEMDNCIVFSGKPGTYKIAPAAEDAEVLDIQWPEAEKEKIGDFAIRLGTTYQYMRDPNVLKDGVPYFSEKFVSENLGFTVTREGNTLKVTTPDGNTTTFIADNDTYTTVNKNGVSSQRKMENVPFIGENGAFYINHSDGVGVALGLNANYIPSAKALIATVKPFATSTPTGGAVSQTQGTLKGVDESKVLWPVSVYASTDDGNAPTNLTDRDLSTRWSSIQGDEEWAVCFMGDEPVEMSAVQIAWYNGDKRHWKFDIQISDDGENFTTVLKGMKSKGESVDVETFELPKGTKAKYIRYLGHGEEVTGSFYNSVTEFIVIK